ncbi:MAG: prepilin-type N-terminal cleavage/methylation domain-containing protein [Candidatus Saccharibacteria bacterium]|nr:prepilin-type N-terminal cleavage/methylation domain-containing protein [Candidatus Saccharibacteria bacterium]
MKHKQGFSIVELIVVIVVIAILFTIAIVSYSWMRKDAETSTYVAAIKQIEKGLHLKYTREGVATWPRDTEMGASVGITNGGSPNMLTVARHEAYNKYLGTLPNMPRQGAWIVYDNDNDTVDLKACNQNERISYWHGVNLAVGGIDRDIMQSIDDQIDDGNLLCGRVRAAATSTGTAVLLYILSGNQSI